VWILSKHKEDPQLADWLVHHRYGEVTVAQSWWERTKAGGYTFRDAAGVCYDFPPGTVDFVHRTEAQQHRLATGPEKVGSSTQTPSWMVKCSCGAGFLGTTEENAVKAVAAHIDDPVPGDG
jgi:hypothetical protein